MLAGMMCSTLRNWYYNFHTQQCIQDRGCNFNHKKLARGHSAGENYELNPKSTQRIQAGIKIQGNTDLINWTNSLEKVHSKLKKHLKIRRAG